MVDFLLTARVLSMLRQIELLLFNRLCTERSLPYNQEVRVLFAGLYGVISDNGLLAGTSMVRKLNSPPTSDTDSISIWIALAIVI